MSAHIAHNSGFGGGTYSNPILYADFSDPDIIRFGEDYFMVASSFCNVPSIPVLHSKDLVNWKVVNYVLPALPSPAYDAPLHGHGVWAPAIRWHDGRFWVCYPMPDEGIYFSTAADPFGAWSKPFPLREGKGWIDPCPFWDDDGKAYLVSAFAKSRTGFKSILNLAEMKPDGTALVGDGMHIFDGHNTQPTIEGPKLYKRNGYYYILAPAGGVPHGWQTALRSRSVWGPYEEKIVMYRGNTGVNGPHQGGLVDTPSGEWWFIHFQDAGVAGRIVHLQPVRWVNDWPVIGSDDGNEGCGAPVAVHKKPDVGGNYAPCSPANSDDFTGDTLGLQWQWNANPRADFYTLGNGLCLNAQIVAGKLCDAPNLLLQKFDAPAFTALAKLWTGTLETGGMAGLVVLGGTYGAAGIVKTTKGLDFVRVTGKINQGEETAEILASAQISGAIYLKLAVNGDDCHFLYSADAVNYIPLFSFITSAGIWVGAKHGLFCINGGGSITVESYHVEHYTAATVAAAF